MCDTISCQRKHDFQEIQNGNIIIKPKEFLSLIDCFIKERKFFCESCGKCDECQKILILLNRYQEIEFEVRKIPRNYIVFFLQFNKIRNILQLEYARIFANLNEAHDMNVFLF